MPAAASAVSILHAEWLGSVCFARSPTGRSFDVTVVVEAERVDQDIAIDDSDRAYVFAQIDIDHESPIHRCVSSEVSAPDLCLSTRWMCWQLRQEVHRAPQHVQ
jgi:hypothetical protein